ncbi:MAG: MBL fold metallo-hydrolase [Deltaproteobacteria bacterium]|nr:MBL fold metallo-hydrolase [Deltaproteobacteria bacterium]
MSMQMQHFFDPNTWTLTYLVYDQDSRQGVVIDPVMDFDPKNGRTRNESSEGVARYIDAHRLTLLYALDTHAHADHLSGMQFFRQRYGAQTVIGARITQVQQRFRDLYNLGPTFPVDGRQFDRLLNEGERLTIGGLYLTALHTPGHTPACMTYQIGDALFVGDTLFQPDYGTARCDFPGGSAAALYDSIQRMYAMPNPTRLFTCHDYQPDGRPLRYESTVGEQKATNIQLNGRTTKEEFIAFRAQRDATLAAPVLILPALQVNIRAGHLPEPESNGVAYLKLPLNVL